MPYEPLQRLWYYFNGEWIGAIVCILCSVQPVQLDLWGLAIRLVAFGTELIRWFSNRCAVGAG
jgi:hypothetical protein